MDVLAMTAGPELDAVIAVHIMNWRDVGWAAVRETSATLASLPGSAPRYCGYRPDTPWSASRPEPVPRYSIGEGQLVLRELERQGWSVEMKVGEGPIPELMLTAVTVALPNGRTFQVTAETRDLALCRAALAAIEHLNRRKGNPPNSLDTSFLHRLLRGPAGVPATGPGAPQVSPALAAPPRAAAVRGATTAGDGEPRRRPEPAPGARVAPGDPAGVGAGAQPALAASEAAAPSGPVGHSEAPSLGEAVVSAGAGPIAEVEPPVLGSAPELEAASIQAVGIEAVGSAGAGETPAEEPGAHAAVPVGATRPPGIRDYAAGFWPRLRSTLAGRRLEHRLRVLERDAAALAGAELARLLDHAGDLCVEADSRERSLGYFGQAIDAYLQARHIEAAISLCRKVIDLSPEVVRTRGTYAFLALGRTLAFYSLDEKWQQSLREIGEPTALPQSMRDYLRTVERIGDYVHAALKSGQRNAAIRRLHLMNEATLMDEVRALIGDYLRELDDPLGANAVLRTHAAQPVDSPAALAEQQWIAWANALRVPIVPPTAGPPNHHLVQH